jgi:hypothetical protein
MSDHTPGPWYVALDDRYSMSHIDVKHTDVHSPGAASEVVAKVTCRVSWADQQKANARLIAAAPDLLDALELLLHDRTPWTIKCAEEAIAKATGAE